MVTNVEIIVLRRLREVCPKKEMSELDILEAKKSCKVAFEIIGFKPRNFDEAFQKTWESSEATMLSDFVYSVWGNGYE
ncbi:MAG: hypothetical protein J6Y78_04640 [Paludibacteraceae bacterium]|nr:hypothetical protein [Paludibacteraceae bacterium]